MIALSRLPCQETACRKELALIGVPFGAGAGLTGCEFAPAALRKRGLSNRLREAGCSIRSDEDVAFGAELSLLSASAAARNPGAVASALRATDTATFAALSAGAFPFVIGGDHSISMGSIAAASRFASRHGKRVVVLWLDAHADFNTPETSPSGNLHGMSLAFLAGAPALAGLAGPRRPVAIRPQDIVILGLRSVDTGEAEALYAAGIRHLDPAQWRRDGITRTIETLLCGFDPEETHLHVSLDLDVIDPAFVPGIGTPVEGGLIPSDIEAALGALAASGRVGSADLVEFNPTRDRDGQTAEIALRLAATLLAAPSGTL